MAKREELQAGLRGKMVNLKVKLPNVLYIGLDADSGLALVPLGG